MKANHLSERPFQFVHRHPENFLVVENLETGVRIRAARDNFDARDKAFFVRHLVDEGFIPDRYGWGSERDGGAVPGIEWCVDGAANGGAGPAARASSPANGFMLRLLACGAVLWLLEITALFCLR